MAFIVRLELYTHQVTVFTFSPFAPKEPCSRQHRSLPTGSSPPSLRQPLPAFLFRCSLSLCMCHANAVIQQTDVWCFAHSQTSQSHSCLFHYSTSCGWILLPYMNTPHASIHLSEDEHVGVSALCQLWSVLLRTQLFAWMPVLLSLRRRIARSCGSSVSNLLKTIRLFSKAPAPFYFSNSRGWSVEATMSTLPLHLLFSDSLVHTPLWTWCG